MMMSRVLARQIGDTRPPSRTESDWLAPSRALVLIVLASVLLRVASALAQGDHVAILPGIDDQISYHSLAVRVLTGHGFSFGSNWWPATRAGEPTAHWSFLYTLYLAGVYLLVGVHPLVARLIQAVAVGILQPLLTMRLGTRLFGKRVGLIAAAISAVYVYFFYYGGALMTESFYIVAILWTLDLVLGLAQTDEAPDLRRPSTWKPWLALGLTIGVATLLRQLILFMVPILFLWLLVVRGRRLRQNGIALLAGLRPTILGLAFSVGVVVLLIIPWTIRNYHAFGMFVPLNTNSGYVFFWGNNPIYGTNFIPILSDEEYQRLIPDNLRSLNEAALDQALLRQGIGFVVDDPGRYVLLSISRAKAYFEFWPSSDSGLASNLGRCLSFGVFLPFMLVGLFLSVRDRDEENVPRWSARVLMYLFMVAYAMIHLLSWALIRYRLPIDALLVIFAARTLDPLLARAVALDGRIESPSEPIRLVAGSRQIQTPGGN